MGRNFANESIPAPDDLAGWKRADSLLSSRFADHLANGQRLRSRKAIRRYFDDDDIGYFFTTHEQRGVAIAYSSWGMLDYRPTKNSRTRAEQLIKEGLPRAQAILLEARMNAHPSLHRVVAHCPDKGTVDMEDVLIGGAVTVHDRLLSENINDGLLIAARTFPVGQYHFFELIGPPLGAGMALDAVDFLQDCGMVLTPEGLKRDAHKFGWLWIWIDEWQASWRTPRLCNTDGHDLLFHTASFAVDDPHSVRDALANRKDIDFDEDAGEFVWSKTTGKAARIPGGPVTLGRIELIGDELVLTVNSAERFADARQWLTKLPGVKFIDVTTREPHAMGDDQPADERMPDEPVDISPEMIDALQDQFDRYYMDWLDQPIPMFGDRTPRQVCQSPEGRERVMMLIRTMPDPGGQVPVRIPRQAMMRELGLATADSQVQAIRDEAPRSLAAPSEARAGRNDPCLCGSGRKYKKCCG